MTDMPSAGNRVYDDLEMLTSYLNNQLDAERVELVRRRLDEDPAFREFAAPLLLVWSIPPHVARHPRPPGELEKHWDEFTKKAGFVHQRRKARRRSLWLLAIVVAAIGATAVVKREQIRDTYIIATKFAPVADSGREMRLDDVSYGTLEPGARLRTMATSANENTFKAILSGSARFRIEHPDPASGPHGFMLQAGDALVATAGATFDVTVVGDTTYVDVKESQSDVGKTLGSKLSMQLPSTVLLANKRPTAAQISVRFGELARVIRGHNPELLRRISDSVVTIPAATTIREEETHTAYMPVDIVLEDGTHAHLDSGAVLHTPLSPKKDEPFIVTLRGSARFVVSRSREAARTNSFGVSAGKAFVATQNADFAIFRRGDTVDVEVFVVKRAAERSRELAQSGRVSIMGESDVSASVMLDPGQRARSIAGHRPSLVPR